MIQIDQFIFLLIILSMGILIVGLAFISLRQSDKIAALRAELLHKKQRHAEQLALVAKLKGE